VLMHRPKGFYRALAQTLRHLEAVAWGRLAAFVV
jgi:hypothetical protein